MVGGVGSDHTTPERRAKLVLTGNPDIIFPDLHSSLENQVAEGKKKPCSPFHHFCEIASHLKERLSFLKAHFLEMRQGRGKTGREMRTMTKHKPSLAWGDFQSRRQDNC